MFLAEKKHQRRKRDSDDYRNWLISYCSHYDGFRKIIEIHIKLWSFTLKSVLALFSNKIISFICLGINFREFSKIEYFTASNFFFLENNMAKLFLPFLQFLVFFKCTSFMGVLLSVSVMGTLLSVVALCLQWCNIRFLASCPVRQVASKFHLPPKISLVRCNCETFMKRFSFYKVVQCPPYLNRQWF